MDMRAIVSMEVVVNNNLYRFEGPNGAATADFHNAAGQFLAKVVEVGEQQSAQATNQAEVPAVPVDAQVS